MKNKTVPRLDLAPKIKPSLSLWNPLDYFRLLFWIFFFPQALLCYEEKLDGESLAEQKNWLEILQFFVTLNYKQRNLFRQGLFLSFLITTISVILLLQESGFTLDWLWIIIILIISSFVTLIINLVGNVGDYLTLKVANNIIIAVFLFLVTINFTSGFWFITYAIIVLSLTANLIIPFYLDRQKHFKSFDLIAFTFFFAGSTAFSSIILCLSFLLLALIPIEIFNINRIIGAIIAIAPLIIGMTLIIFPIFLRIDNWLIGVIFNRQSCEYSRVTAIPLPFLTRRLQNWLERDWEKGIYNINQIIKYTFQSIPAIVAINKALDRTPSQLIIYRVSQLAENPVDWNLLLFSSASLREYLKSKFFKNFFATIQTLFFLSSYLETTSKRIENSFIKDPRLDTPSRATAAGFWYLYEKDPEKAQEAFAVVKNLPYGEEMFALASSLKAFKQAEKIDSIAFIQLPTIPKEIHLRPNTWKVIKSLDRVIEDIRLVKQGVSKSTRSFALNRALGELREIIDRKQTLPIAERELILDIAKRWKKSLERIALDIGEISITSPVSNPYIIGDPVTGNLFVGREDIIRQLEEIWVTGKQLQSVVLYGHRRMGKTSILQNIANCAGAKVKVIYVNLMWLGSVSNGLTEVLMAICDAISNALNIPPPEDEGLLKFPERTFKRYLQEILQNKDRSNLIIALDEFEIIEELIETKEISSNFLVFLRSLVQMNPNLAFVFAGLHTLEEMTADYFQPFFASVIPIRVSFLSRVATRQILANPDPDFLLDYTGEALDLIYDLTRGQPFLVQLIGFQLVRLYNDYVFEKGIKRSPTFTPEDVKNIINKDFFSDNKYYFSGVWQQAGQDIEGQQAIIKALAPHSEGLNKNELTKIIAIEKEKLLAAINTLKSHDVIEEKDSKYRIIVELFRLWVLENRETENY